MILKRKKNLIFIAYEKEGVNGTKKVQLAAKKRGTRGFGTSFLLFTFLYVIFEKQDFICLAKKMTISDKKYPFLTSFTV